MLFVVTYMVMIFGLIYNCFRRNIYSVVNSDHVEMYSTLNTLRKLTDQKWWVKFRANDSDHLDVLALFVDQVRTHHNREEGLMNRYNYPQTREHTDRAPGRGVRAGDHAGHHRL